MAFERSFTDIKKLTAEPLFHQCLMPDIVESFRSKRDRYRNVFPAVRKNRIDFYHKGGKLFSYNGRLGFTTHHKYASVIKHDARNQYVTEAGLQAIDGFVAGYERIKENCALYSGLEGLGVSRVCADFSFARHKRSQRVVVLDIEVSLRRDDEAIEPEPGIRQRANSDRIDLLLFDTERCLLRFFETKDFSNNEIRAATDGTPAIVKQMERYAKQLQSSTVNRQLLINYAAYIDVMNELFTLDRPLPAPKEIDPVPRLLVFGFDRSQLTVKLKKEIRRLESDFDLSVYAIGDIGGVNAGTLFSGGQKRW